jgi:hypothetical protein
MANATKTGTAAIERCAITPESFGFESGPWTSFYVAGGIIRELRKASRKKSGCGSERSMAHGDKLIEPYDHPSEVLSLPEDDPSIVLARSRGLLKKTTIFNQVTPILSR